MTRPAGWPWHDDPENGRRVADLRRDLHELSSDLRGESHVDTATDPPSDRVEELLSEILTAVRDLDRGATYWTRTAVAVSWLTSLLALAVAVAAVGLSTSDTVFVWGAVVIVGLASVAFLGNLPLRKAARPAQGQDRAPDERRR